MGFKPISIQIKSEFGGGKMDCRKFTSVAKKYKKCPKCGASWKGHDMCIELENEVIHISCTCGFSKYVDENNKEVNKI